MATEPKKTDYSHPSSLPRGGAFLMEELSPEEVFTPEDFTGQHRLISQAAEEFYVKEILTHWERIEQQEPRLTPQLLRRAGELGLLSTDLPERFGGAALDKVSATLIVEQMARYASFGASFTAHTVIGTLPIAYFGTEAQKKKYLPRLASGELIAAYCLSETTSASDALAARARATLSADGQHYTLNGEKMWISNAGFADVFIVFAKVDGEKFSCFIVERAFPGVSTGAEEKKMGLKGSSTRALILDNVPVPAENLLGELGRGHVIAFNILNIGRFRLAGKGLGAAKEALRHSLDYARQRRAFGRPIAEFGLIQEKLAEMATRIYVGESMVYRTAGLLDSALRDIDPESAEGAARNWQTGEEYAIECSINKVFLTEVLAYVVDEAVQIYGGYGYHQDYPAERAYRDARITRIYEGTNEINRLVITSQLLRRTTKGRLPPIPAIASVMKELEDTSIERSGESAKRPSTERTLVNQVKKVALFVVGGAQQRFGDALPAQQQVVAAISDIIVEAFAMESALLRSEKRTAQGRQSPAEEWMTKLYLCGSIERVERKAGKALAAIFEGSLLNQQLAILSMALRREPVDIIALQRKIAGEVIARGSAPPWASFLSR